MYGMLVHKAQVGTSTECSSSYNIIIRCRFVTIFEIIHCSIHSEGSGLNLYLSFSSLDLTSTRLLAMGYKLSIIKSLSISLCPSHHLYFCARTVPRYRSLSSLNHVPLFTSPHSKSTAVIMAVWECVHKALPQSPPPSVLSRQQYSIEYFYLCSDFEIKWG